MRDFVLLLQQALFTRFDCCPPLESPQVLTFNGQQRNVLVALLVEVIDHKNDLDRTGLLQRCYDLVGLRVFDAEKHQFSVLALFHKGVEVVQLGQRVVLGQFASNVFHGNHPLIPPFSSVDFLRHTVHQRGVLLFDQPRHLQGHVQRSDELHGAGLLSSDNCMQIANVVLEAQVDGLVGLARCCVLGLDGVSFLHVDQEEVIELLRVFAVE
jgi:hypothetical protein